MYPSTKKTTLFWILLAFASAFQIGSIAGHLRADTDCTSNFLMLASYACFGASYGFVCYQDKRKQLTAECDKQVDVRWGQQSSEADTEGWPERDQWHRTLGNWTQNRTGVGVPLDVPRPTDVSQAIARANWINSNPILGGVERDRVPVPDNRRKELGSNQEENTQ